MSVIERHSFFPSAAGGCRGPASRSGSCGNEAILLSWGLGKEKPMKRRTLSAGRHVAVLAVALAAACGRAPSDLRVKGLYLGMPLGEAVRTAEALYRQVEGAAFRPVQWRQLDSYSQHTDRPAAMDMTFGARDGRLRLIVLNPGLADRLFAASDLSAERLAQRFAAEHRLPALQHGINANPPQPEHYWQYVSRRGWKVVIDQNKCVVLSFWRATPNEKF